MREGWKKMSILDVCKVYQPQTIATSKLIEGAQYDVFGANGCIGKYNQYNHEEDEVLLTCRGATCGNINRSTPKSWINGNAMVVHPIGSGLIKDFLMYALKSVDFSKVITGAAQPQITRTSLSSVTLSIPPLYEQERIVSLLDLEFAKIDAIKANAEKQLQDAKDLFQFALKDLLTPKEWWENVKLVEEFDLKSGDYLPSKEQKGGCVPVYGGNGIAGYHDISNISGEQIIIGRVGALCGNIHYTIGDVWVTDNAFIVKNISTEWNRGYLKYVLEYLDLNQYATQSAQPVISNKSMKEVNLFKPSIDEQIIIFRKIELIQLRYLQLESNIKKTITLCNDLKKSILKDIFG